MTETEEMNPDIAEGQTTIDTENPVTIAHEELQEDPVITESVIAEELLPEEEEENTVNVSTSDKTTVTTNTQSQS